ncbi:transcriptional regulator [Saccharothrix deserti]|uniref:transcriptional regulator n=1 Tax=Saccharothrix deserti TaxID=2593674 RepID=UPI00131AFE53|nr:transcriptional regulator [Saccharothrix deserti]
MKLRVAEFQRSARRSALTSDYLLAPAMGVNRSTISRVLTGELRPGAAFIAGALAAFAPLEVRFEDLFEVETNWSPDERSSGKGDGGGAA